MKIKVSKYIVDFFVKNGVSDCFMVTGGGAMHLNDAIGHQEKMHCTFNHHEQACAIAAEGYARMTGRIAAVCVTSGPGGVNAMTGVLGGWLDSIPMFVVSGQVKRETTIRACQELNLRQLGDQEFNVIDAVCNMTKYAWMVTNPAEIAYHLEKAWFLALHGRKGPVWLDIPLDVQGAVVDTETLLHFDAEQENPWQTPLVKQPVADMILQKLKESKSPLVLAGTGIRLSGSTEKLLSFLEKYRIPVVTAWNANDTVEYCNPYYVGMPGTVGTRPGNFAVQNCDLLISLGCRMNIRMIGYSHYDFAHRAFKIVVDIDAREIMKPTIQPELAVHADVGQFLDMMLAQEYAPVEEHKKWTKWCRNLLHRFPVVLPEYYSYSRKRINPYVFIEKLFAHLKSDDRIICGNGSACVVTFQAAKVIQGQRMFSNSGCAAMGYGFPAAVGVAVSDNSRRTVCIDGDGSVMMNLQELATVAYNKLDLKLIILNNNGYLSIRQTQESLFEPPFIGIDSKSGICFPDFRKLAESFGIDYFKIENEAEFDETMNVVLRSGRACICEAFVDSEQNFSPKSAAKVLPDGRIVSPSIDDMKPFLDRGEYEEINYERYCESADS